MSKPSGYNEMESLSFPVASVDVPMQQALHFHLHHSPVLPYKALV